jgi:hypothetical protein
MSLYAGPVRTVAASADGTTAAGGDEDGTVRVWDLATGTEVVHWVGDHGILTLAAVPGYPFRFVVGQQRGQPYLLQLQGPVASALRRQKCTAYFVSPKGLAPDPLSVGPVAQRDFFQAPGA